MEVLQCVLLAAWGKPSTVKITSPSHPHPCAPHSPSLSNLVCFEVNPQPLPSLIKPWKLKPSNGWVCVQTLEKETATHSSILARIILCTEEPGGLKSMGSLRVGYDWATEHACSDHVLPVASNPSSFSASTPQVRIILCAVGCPRHCRMLSSIAGIFPLDPRGTLSPLNHKSQLEVSSDIAKCSLGAGSTKLPPVENLWTRSL